mmetsp:Transcript_68207/g.79391  ORF Transcript_68207/g.79391 Transcript_68207/m.79391 type:complete len:621 (+) Transcript_68207:288-2150(+)
MSNGVDVQYFWNSASPATIPTSATTDCGAPTAEDEDATTLLQELQLTLNSVRSCEPTSPEAPSAVSQQSLPTPPVTENATTPASTTQPQPPVTTQSAPHVVMSANGSCQLVGLGDTPVPLIPVMLPTGQVVMLPATISPSTAPPPPMPSFAPQGTLPQSPPSLQKKLNPLTVGNASRSSLATSTRGGQSTAAIQFPSEPLTASPGNSVTSNPAQGNGSICGAAPSKNVPSPQSLGLSQVEDPITPEDDANSENSGADTAKKGDAKPNNNTPPTTTAKSDSNPENPSAAEPALKRTPADPRDIGSRPNHGTNVHDALAGKLTFNAYRTDVKRPSACLQTTTQTQTLPVFVQMFPSEWIHDAKVVFQEVICAICGPRCAVVERIEPRSETSFIAFVKTAQLWDLISALRCRCLMDRHGFWYASSWQQYLDMKTYCEVVRRMPQQQRHYKTDGLPCMPLVVELSRMVAIDSVLAPPATQVPFDTHLPMNDGTAHGARGGRQNGRNRPASTSATIPAVVSVASNMAHQNFVGTAGAGGPVMYFAPQQQLAQQFSQFNPATAPYFPAMHMMQPHQPHQPSFAPALTIGNPPSMMILPQQPHMHAANMRFMQQQQQQQQLRGGMNF